MWHRISPTEVCSPYKYVMQSKKDSKEVAVLINSERLAYTPDSKTFSCEASDLMGDGFSLPREIRVKSHRTGDVRTFTLHHKQRDPEGELQFIDYSDGQGITLRIFND